MVGRGRQGRMGGGWWVMGTVPGKVLWWRMRGRGRARHRIEMVILCFLCASDLLRKRLDDVIQ